jgi:carbon monoxide dehydrogenase subunit G
MNFTIDKSLEIAAPVESVWEVITDFAHYGECGPMQRGFEGMSQGIKSRAEQQWTARRHSRSGG